MKTAPLETAGLEALEARIAPASFTFTDVDGDRVTISTTKGTTPDIVAAAALVPLGDGFQLESLNLGANPIFAGNSVSIVATRLTFNGDGLVHVGVIDGGSLNFGKVTVDGDLGKILAGAGDAKKKAITTLQVFSLGVKGTSTGADDLVSVLQGSVGEIRVATDIDNATISVPAAGAKVGKLIVGSDIIGGAANQSGAVTVAGTLSSVSVGGNLIGGTGGESGRLSAATLTSLIIKGSINGGAGNDAGTVEVSGTNSVSGTFRVGLDVTGGTGDRSGVIEHAGTVRSFTVGGNLIGGDGAESGSVRALAITTLVNGQSIFGKGGNESGVYQAQTFDTVRIGGDVFGGAGLDSGGVRADTEIKQLTLGGGLYGNSAPGSGFLTTDASGKIGKLTLGGSLYGSSGEGSGLVFTGTLGNGSVTGSFFGGSGAYSGSMELITGYGSLKVGQDLKGSSGQYSGGIYLTGPSTLEAGTLKIGGRVVGGFGAGSGSILGSDVEIKAKSLMVSGAVEGGQGAQSGRIDLAGNFGTVKFGGLIRGGEGVESGSVRLGSAGTFSVAGDVRGGLSSSGSGSIVIEGAVKTLSLGGILSGGTNQSASTMVNSGAVLVGGTIGKMTLAGSLLGGNSGTSDDLNLGAIRSGGSIGTLTIEGSVQGSGTMPALITAKGSLAPTGSKNLAFGNIAIAGSVIQSSILAGYDTQGSGLNGDGGASGGSAQIGTVSVAGDWTASSLVAGAETGADGVWGSATNALLPKANPFLVASIAKIVVGGAIAGLPGVQNGFVAERFASFIAGGDTLLIPSDPPWTQIGPLPTQEIRVV